MIEHRFRAMNTDIHVIVVGGSHRHLEQAECAVRDRESRWSRFLSGSELSRLNASQGRPVIVSRDTFALVTQAIDAYALTGGAFDPTVHGCLVDAGYGRSFEPDRMAAEVAASAPTPTPMGIVLDDHVGAVRLPPGVSLDLGGIAKGATADAVVGQLLEAGVGGCCVNLGGDLRVGGVGPDRGGWTVELECPGADGRRQISLADGAVCTSTITKRKWRNALGPQHHLRHPASGTPFDTGLLTVSVIAA